MSKNENKVVLFSGAELEHLKQEHLRNEVKRRIDTLIKGGVPKEVAKEIVYANAEVSSPNKTKGHYTPDDSTQKRIDRLSFALKVLEAFRSDKELPLKLYIVKQAYLDGVLGKGLVKQPSPTKRIIGSTRPSKSAVRTATPEEMEEIERLNRLNNPKPKKPQPKKPKNNPYDSMGVGEALSKAKEA